MKDTKSLNRDGEKRLYLVYDGRAIGGDTDAAMVMVSCDSLKEARSYKGDFGNDCVIYSYKIVGENLIEERFEEIL